MGAQRYPRTRVLVTTRASRLGEMRAFRQRSKNGGEGFEPGVMVMSIVAGWETNVRLSAFLMANRMKTTTKPKQIPP